MIKIKLFALVLISVFSCSQVMAQKGKKTELSNKADSVSYAIGVSVAHSIASQNISNLNVEKLSQALEDVLDKKEGKITVEESQQIIQDYMQSIQGEVASANLIAANEFLEANKKNEGIVTLPSGLQYQVIVEGEGASPVRSDKVKTHYRGTLIDGTQFDSSYDRGEPISFAVTGVIKGWTEALLLMKPGAKWKLFIPPGLAYGERGTGPIPANSLLIFEIELLGIE